MPRLMARGLSAAGACWGASATSLRQLPASPKQDNICSCATVRTLQRRGPFPRESQLPLVRGRSGESQLGGETTDDQSYGHVAVAFAEIARTSSPRERSGKRCNRSSISQSSPSRVATRPVSLFGRVTGHHAGVLPPPRPRDRFGPIRRGGLGHHKETLLDESLEGDGKQTSPRRENGGTRVKSANRWLFPLLTSQNKEHSHGNNRQGKEHRPTDEGKAEGDRWQGQRNDKLRAEGKADQVKGNLKQAGEKLKDAVKK